MFKKKLLTKILAMILSASMLVPSAPLYSLAANDDMQLEELTAPEDIDGTEDEENDENEEVTPVEEVSDETSDEVVSDENEDDGEEYIEDMIIIDEEPPADPPEEEPKFKFEENWDNLSVLTLVPKEGNFLTKINGEFALTASTEALENLTEKYREECITTHVPNPYTATPEKPTSVFRAMYELRNTKKLYWSADYEAIARQRAVEASLMFDAYTTARPNGDKNFNNLISFDGTNYIKSNAEIKMTVSGSVADPIKEALDRINKTKNIYVSDFRSRDAANYKNLIDPLTTCFGAAAFKLEGSSNYVVVIELGRHKTGNPLPAKKGDLPDYDAWPSKQTSTLTTRPDGFAVEIDKSYYKDYIAGIDRSVPTEYEGQLSSLIFEINKRRYVGDIIGSEIKADPEYITINDDKSYKIGTKEGEFKIEVTAGTVSKSKDIEVLTNEHALTIKAPDKTVYVAGEKIDYKGGSVVNNSKADVKHTPVALSANNTSLVGDVDFNAPGKYDFAVKSGLFTKNFSVLVVKPLDITVEYGFTQTEFDAKVAAEADAYGSYAINDFDISKCNTVGKKTFTATYTPNSADYTANAKIPVTINVVRTLDGSNGDVNIRLVDDTYNFTGNVIEPEVKVDIDGVYLKENIDYEIVYGDDTHDNINFGKGIIVVKGKGDYYGQSSVEFDIVKNKLTVTANSYTISKDIAEMPVFTVNIVGLKGNDKVVWTDGVAETVSSVALDGDNKPVVGSYVLKPNSAKFTVLNDKDEDVTGSYDIEFVDGNIKVVEKHIYYNVNYELNGHGTKAADSIPAGEMIPVFENPVDAGYDFVGWYKDAAFKTIWNFNADIVQDNITLYARWTVKKSNNFSVEAIPDQTYTGLAIRPTFTIYDNGKLLTSGRDYVATYYNNINVNTTPAGTEFDASLPYVKIQGRGNYSDVYTFNFNIVPASIGDTNKNVNNGFTLNCNDVFTVSTREQKTVNSLRGKKVLVLGKDYSVSLFTDNVYDKNNNYISKNTECAGAKIPAGYSGRFKLVVKGLGNFTGEINKFINVTDANHNITKATVTIDAKYRSITFTGKNVTLPSSAVTVKMGKTTLVYGKNYTLDFADNDKVGRATVIIKGLGSYAGSKNAVFTITGKVFNANTVKVENIPEAFDCTGLPITVNNAKLTYKNADNTVTNLLPGFDYTVSYRNNINRGVAIVTFKGNEKAGYKGTVTCKFRINSIDISKLALVSVDKYDDEISAVFKESGATIPVSIVNKISNVALVEGKDYTVTYSRNKELGSVTDTVPPTATIKGRGNYSGILKKTFNIIPDDDFSGVTYTVAQMQFADNRKDNFIYKPAVSLVDISKGSRVNAKRYTVEYNNCDQASVKAYLNGEISNPDDYPQIEIKAVDKNGYTGSIKNIVLPVYKAENKITANNIYVVCEKVEYTGSAVVPVVRIYHVDDLNTMKEVKKYKNHDDILAAGGSKVQLVDNSNFTITYKNNVLAGKSRGSVTLTGKTPLYGGSLTGRFDIATKTVLF